METSEVSVKRGGKGSGIQGSSKGGLLKAGGILSIIGGAFEVIGGGIWVVGLVAVTVMQGEVSVSLVTGNSSEGVMGIMTPIVIPSWSFIVAAALLVLGIIAIVGGMSALRRKKFGLALAGAICALPSMILGILAVIFVAQGKREFGRGGQENGI